MVISSNYANVQNIKTYSTRPVQERCYFLGQYLPGLSDRDLKSTFFDLIADIFGLIPSGPDWNLLTTPKQSLPAEYDAIQKFLNPKGPLFDVIYRLLPDVSARYEFLLTDLPENTRMALEQGSVSSYFASKLCFPVPTQQPTCLLLNSFEYYFFHFAKYLEKTTNSNPKTFDTLYSKLLQDYLSYFLPTDSDHVPPINSDSIKQISMSTINTSSFNQSQLLKPGLMLASSSSLDHTQIDTWRSEALLYILSELWLNSTDVSNQTLAVMVRVLIKHVHYFSNDGFSSEFESTLYPCGPPPLTINYLKCTVLSHILQKKLFSYFNHMFNNWPLDASFKLPLEAWLSYIQPWRYVLSGNLSTSISTDCIVELRWNKFISENLPFYSSIFILIIPRFFRMELDSVKNSQNLFRITKVFNQENLISLILTAEDNVQSEINIISIHSDVVRSLVSQLLLYINQAKHTLPSVSSNEDNNNWANYFSSFLATSEESIQDDTKKVIECLDASINNLCNSFKLNPPVTSNKSSISQETNQDYDAENHRLTDVGRYRIINRLTQPQVSYRGHPDLRPICTFEVAFLVRILYQISQFLNSKYGPIFQERYERQDWIGTISRRLLAPPATYHLNDTAINLPARLVLRDLAHHRFVFYSVLTLLFAYLIGYSGHLIFLVVLGLLFVFCILGMSRFD